MLNLQWERGATTCGLVDVGGAREFQSRICRFRGQMRLLWKELPTLACEGGGDPSYCNRLAPC